MHSKTRGYNDFVEDFKQAKEASFYNEAIPNYKVEAKILKLLEIAPEFIEKMTLNENFKKILLLEINYIVSISKEFS
jgi:hypothetical protein